MTPVFIGWTRSFWGYVATALLAMSDIGEPAARAVAVPLALAAGGDPDEWAGYATQMLPLIPLGFAMYQRSGATRPYTMKINRDTLQ